MKRRTALGTLGALTGHAMFPAILAGYLTSCRQSSTEKYTPIFFSNEEIKTLQEVLDIVFPASDTPSASAVHVYHFLDEVFAKCMTSDQQKAIKSGMSLLKEEMDKNPDHLALLTDIDQKAFSGNPEWGWFRYVKQYGLVGYFTSQQGMEKATQYIPVPGDYKGEITIDEETVNFARTNLHYYL